MNLETTFGPYEAKALKEYVIKRDALDMVHIVYCTRCLNLVDVSPFKFDIYATCVYHSALHSQVGFLQVEPTDELHEVEWSYIGTLGEAEAADAAFRSMRRKFWRSTLGIASTLYDPKGDWV